MASAPFDPFTYAHAHRREIVWMSQNTNHLVPPEPATNAIRQALDERRYKGYPFGAASRSSARSSFRTSGCRATSAAS